jgi:hypothetical protein
MRLLPLVTLHSFGSLLVSPLLSAAACCLWLHCPTSKYLAPSLPAVHTHLHTAAAVPAGTAAAAAAAGDGSVVAVNSCLLPVASLGGCHVITSEGLGNSRSGFHEVQGESLSERGTNSGGKQGSNQRNLL